MFYSENFSFNGIDNESMDIALVATENTDIINQLGTVYIENIKVENTRTNNPYYLFESRETETLTLEFAYVDLESQVALPWDEEKIDEVVNWLFTDTFKPFISQDNDELVYYLKAIKIYKKFNEKMEGLLEVEFQPYTAYAYRPITYKVICDESIEYKVENISTVLDEYYEPIIEIKKTKDIGNVQIENISIENDKPLVLENMKVNETIIIDNHNFTVFNTEGENKFSSCNRQWIRFKKGKNTLKIMGSCELLIKCNYPKIV